VELYFNYPMCIHDVYTDHFAFTFTSLSLIKGRAGSACEPSELNIFCRLPFVINVVSHCLTISALCSVSLFMFLRNKGFVCIVMTVNG